MTVERHARVGLPAELLTKDNVEAISATVHMVWAEMELSSTPQVAVVSGPLAEVVVDGELLPVSARRIEAATIAGSGEARHPDETGSPHQLLADRLASTGTPTASAIIAHVVDATLRGALPGLVRAESAAIAQRLGATLEVPWPIDVAAEAISLAAELGVSPPDLRADDVIGEPVIDPYALCERFLTAAENAGRLCPTIELNPRTLRRLTTGATAFRAGTGGQPGSAQGLKDELFTDYGVRLPPISLRAVDQPEWLVRFRFGAHRTPAHLVLPEGQWVKTAVDGEGVLEASTRLFINPVRGERYSLTDNPVDTNDPWTTFDPADLVMRTLFAEAKTRLAMWSPTASFLADQVGVPLGMTGLHLPEAGAALRWLLASQVSVHPIVRLSEGIVSAEARRATTVPAIADHLRASLAMGVQGPVLTAVVPEVIGIDEALALAAVDQDSAAPLIERTPNLVTAVGQVVVTCPARLRRDIERLLWPLRDTAIVIAEEERQALPQSAA